ncbi:MAG: LapA family protein [Acidimicrobiales bacterium]
MRRRPAQPDAPAGQEAGPTAISGAATGGEQPKPVIPASRAALVWGALAAGMALLVVVLVFILENLTSVKASFFTIHWKIPLGVDLLFAAVLGGLIVFAAGSLRILQLRRLAHRHARTHEEDE